MHFIRHFIGGIFIAIIILSGCGNPQHKESKILTIKEFTTLYRDTLSKRFPQMTFKMTDDSTISGKLKDKNFTIVADNAYLGYKATPDAITSVWEQYIPAMEEMFREDRKIHLDKIVPMIKPNAYLDEIKAMAQKMNSKKRVEYPIEKYNDQLIIVYAEDTKTNIKYLIKDSIDALHIDMDSLKRLAIHNLDKLLTNVESKGDKGVYIITAGGNYEASVILLTNIFTKQNLPVKGEFIIAIPNRDLLLVTGSEDAEGIAQVKKITKEYYETGGYPLSQYLYKWNGERFVKYQ